MPDIIIVEDNREIGTLLCDFLRKENYTVSLVDTGEKALQIFEQYGANLVVIDIGLPGVDGYSVCSKIRETSNAHIMIATARDDKESTLKGLQIGADDYICKPYDIDILIAKINGIFKRKYALDEIVCDNLKLNNVTQTLTVNQTPVNVTEKEFQLLKLLVENKGTTLKKEYLFNRIWGCLLYTSFHIALFWSLLLMKILFDIGKFPVQIGNFLFSRLIGSCLLYTSSIKW